MANIDWKSLHVLLVDDNKYVCLLVQAVLRSVGIRNIRVANDGATALSAFREHSHDVAVVDAVMEGINGIEFSKSVRSDKQGGDNFMPILMISAYNDIGTIRNAINSGVNDFLAKPLVPAALVTRLARMMLVQRQFIRTSAFFGPDRRRTRPLPYNGAERRKTPS